jgi:tetratricopeptide (TPR) repeat protein
MSDQLKEEGLALFARGDYRAALATFQEAADAYGRADDLASQAEMLNNLGVLYRLQRDWPAALQALTEARTLFADLADRKREAQVWANLGDLYANQRNQEQAARAYSQASALFGQVAEPDGELRWKWGQALRALSLLRLRQRRIMEAMAIMEQSLTVRGQLDAFAALFRLMLRFALWLMGAR